MNKYTNYCSAEQTKRALNLGAPLESKPLRDFDYDEQYYYCKGNGKYYVIPTTQQMFGWLRGQGFVINLLTIKDTGLFVYYQNEVNIIAADGYKHTYEEAEYMAIDAALTYLEKKGE